MGIFSATLTCRRIDGMLSGFADGVLAHAERREVAVHLRECDRCARRQEELTRSRMLLKALPVKTPPALLTARLSMLASREAALRRTEVRRDYDSGFAWSGWKQRAENLMRPLAIPFAGGLVSALVLFSMLVPTYPVIARAAVNGDVPTAFYQEPSVKIDVLQNLLRQSWAPFGISDDEVVVELFLDEQGQVIDYKIPRDKTSPELRREIENTLLFARFTPALSFGQPINGKLRLTFRRSHIDVKG
jgi:hypothetical protein